jgi:hypothetical protein
MYQNLLDIIPYNINQVNLNRKNLSNILIRS